MGRDVRAEGPVNGKTVKFTQKMLSVGDPAMKSAC